MKLSRRSLFGVAAGAAIAPVIPAFVAPLPLAAAAPAVLGNTFLTPAMVTRQALMILHQKLNFVGSINRNYDNILGNVEIENGEFDDYDDIEDDL